MLEYKYTPLFLRDSIDKQIKIEFDAGVITNNELHSEQFELIENICSESNLRFGSCEASMLKVKKFNMLTSLKGKWLTVSSTLDGNTDEPFVFGRYKAYSDEATADKRFREITAYDAMYDILHAEVSHWYNKILPNTDSKVTLKEFRTSFLEYFGLEQEEVELINDPMIVEKTIEPTTLSGKSVITAICEINGCFGHIGRNGKFRYIFLKPVSEAVYPAENLYPAEGLYPAGGNPEVIQSSYYKACTYEDFVTAPITKLQLRKEENDIGTIIGDGSNCYIVEDNFLLYGKGEAELNEIGTNLFEVIKDVVYRPCQVEAKGNPCIEVGDAINIHTRDCLVESYVLRRTLKGIQALSDSYEAEGEELQTEKVNSVRQSIIELKGKTNTLTRNVEETRSYIADTEKKLSSEIQQNANEIALRVRKGEVISEINISPEKITISAEKIDLVGIVNADTFISNLIEAEKLNAKFATITRLESNEAEIKSLKTEKLNAAEFTAGNISAMNITVQSANVQGTLSVEQLDINGIIGEMTSRYISIFELDVGGIFRYGGYTWTPRTINGVTYLVAGGTIV